MKRGTVFHPKFQRLQARLSIPAYAAAGILEMLWQMAGMFARRGDIGRFSNSEIAAWLGWQGDPDELIEALVDAGWLDRCETHRLVIHDWQDHADAGVRRSQEVRERGFATPGAPERDARATEAGRPDVEKNQHCVEKNQHQAPDRVLKQVKKPAKSCAESISVQQSASQSPAQRTGAQHSTQLCPAPPEPEPVHLPEPEPEPEPAQCTPAQHCAKPGKSGVSQSQNVLAGPGPDGQAKAPRPPRPDSTAPSPEIARLWQITALRLEEIRPGTFSGLSEASNGSRAALASTLAEIARERGLKTAENQKPDRGRRGRAEAGTGPAAEGPQKGPRGRG